MQEEIFTEFNFANFGHFREIKSSAIHVEYVVLLFILFFSLYFEIFFLQIQEIKFWEIH